MQNMCCNVITGQPKAVRITLPKLSKIVSNHHHHHHHCTHKAEENTD